MITSFNKDVEAVLDFQTVHRREIPLYEEYLIKWKALPHGETNAERTDTLWQFEKQIHEFLKTHTTKTMQSVGEIIMI